MRLGDMLRGQPLLDAIAAHHRDDGWHGDTHDSDGKPLEEAKGKPKISRCVWSPPAAQPDDQVDELHVIYDDGEVVKVPAADLVIP